MSNKFIIDLRETITGEVVNTSYEFLKDLQNRTTDALEKQVIALEDMYHPVMDIVTSYELIEKELKKAANYGKCIYTHRFEIDLSKNGIPLSTTSDLGLIRNVTARWVKSSDNLKGIPLTVSTHKNNAVLTIYLEFNLW